MPSSLIREQHITFASSLAATIGLEEAVLLQVLAECLRHRSGQHRDGYRWIELSKDEALELLPFWSEQDIDRIGQKLQNLGIIRLGASGLMLGDRLVFALNEPEQAPVTAAPPPVEAVQPAQPLRPQRGAQQIPDEWQPGTELLRKLQEINGVPSDFALQLVPEFITYWRDRQATTYSWESRFMSHAQRQWQQQAARPEPVDAPVGSRPGTAMDHLWRPGEDALAILLRSGIEQQFVEDAIPEFILYWRARGDVCNTWDTKFIAHIRRQWAYYESNMQFDTEPQRITSDWQPSEDVYDILRLANIEVDFARQLVPEFVIYWRDTNKAFSSWNTRFLQHVKTRWARRLNGEEAGPKDYGKRDQSAVEPDRRGFVDKHTDRSWREGL